jgi:anti-sigma factor RsiW
MRDRWIPRNAVDPDRCEPFRELLSAWMDDELPPTLMEAVDRHLETCVHCTRDLRDLRRTVALVREVLAPNLAPQLRDRGRPGVPRPRHQAATRITDRRRRGRSLQLATAGITIALISGALTYGVMRRQTFPAPNDIASRVIASHVRGLVGDHLVDAASSDSHTVKPWFDRHVDFSPTVPRLEALGFPLLGGRVDRVAGRRVAAIMYGLRKHVIGVFTWPSAAPGPASAAERAAREDRGYRALHWVDRDMEYWVVSDVSLADLRAFTMAFRAAAGGGGRDASQR